MGSQLSQRQECCNFRIIAILLDGDKMKWTIYIYSYPVDEAAKLTRFLFWARITLTYLLIPCNASGKGGQILSAFIAQPHKGWEDHRKGQHLLWLAVCTSLHTYTKKEEIWIHWKMANLWQAKLEPGLFCFNSLPAYDHEGGLMHCYHQHFAHVTQLKSHELFKYLASLMCKVPVLWKKTAVFCF